MTNILIGSNRYIVDAAVTASSTATGYTGNNLLTAGRWSTWCASSAGTSHTVKFDLGSGTTLACDYMVLGRADYCIKDDDTCSFVLAGSNDDSSYTNWHDSGTLTSADLVGPNDQEYAVIDTASDAYRYWRLTIAYGASGTPELAKVYLGTALDLGRDPYEIQISKTRQHFAAYKPVHEINLAWSGVSYASTLTLRDTVGELKDWHPIYLLTSTYHDALLNYRAIHCRVLSLTTPQQITAFNDIRMICRELI
jgi:hypothetical protein